MRAERTWREYGRLLLDQLKQRGLAGDPRIEEAFWAIP